MATFKDGGAAAILHKTTQYIDLIHYFLTGTSIALTAPAVRAADYITNANKYSHAGEALQRLKDLDKSLMIAYKLVPLMAAALLLAASETARGESTDTRSVLESEWRQGYLEGAIRHNPHLRHCKIEIDTEGDKVRLTGLVPSKAAKALAEQIALSAPAVGKVENRLTVVAIAPQNAEFGFEIDTRHLSNVPITNKVMARLQGHADTRGLKVTAETRNRVVIVKGEVSSELEKELVFWLVKNTDGVKEVVDKMEVTLSHQIQAGL